MYSNFKRLSYNLTYSNQLLYCLSQVGRYWWMLQSLLFIYIENLVLIYMSDIVLTLLIFQSLFRVRLNTCLSVQTLFLCWLYVELRMSILICWFAVSMTFASHVVFFKFHVVFKGNEYFDATHLYLFYIYFEKTSLSRNLLLGEHQIWRRERKKW